MKENQVSLNELLRKAKERSGLSQEVLRQSLHALLGAISEVMDDGKGVVLDNFGSFELRTIKERTITLHRPTTHPSLCQSIR